MTATAANIPAVGSAWILLCPYETGDLMAAGLGSVVRYAFSVAA